MVGIRKTYLIIIGLIITSILSMLPRILDPDAHWGGDESKWIMRSFEFLNALYKHDLSQLPAPGHPGVITMWIGSLGLWTKYRHIMFMVGDRRSDILSNGRLKINQLSLLTTENLARIRIIMAIFNSIVICALSFMIFRLFGFPIAAISILLICYDPTFLSESRKVHVDAPLTGMVLLSIMSILCYFELSKKKLFIVLSGIFLGLACLAKITGLILLAYLPLILILYHFFHNHNNDVWCLEHLAYVSNIFSIWIGSALLTVLVIWPAMWISFIQINDIRVPSVFIFFPIAALLVALGLGFSRSGESNTNKNVKWQIIIQVILLAIAFVALNLDERISSTISWAQTSFLKSHEFPQRYLGKVIHDPGKLYYVVMISIYGTLISVVMSLVGFIYAIIKLGKAPQSRHLRLGVALLIFVVLYVFYMSLGAKKLSRYMLPVYPLLDIGAAITIIALVIPTIRFAINKLLSWKIAVIKPNLVYSSANFIIALCIGWQIISVLSLHPNYAAYISPLWERTNITNLTLIGRGVGIKEAAEYLNEINNVESITVRASFLCGEWLPYYFKGKVVNIDSEPSNVAQYDIVYIQDIQIGSVDKNLYMDRKPEKSIKINGIDYVMIYRL